MNDKLMCLINDFQKAVQVALKIMQRSGIPMPYSRNDWIELDISNIKELDNGIKYYKHGAGCKVMFDSGTVDFDFGVKGEVGGFNFWWLTRFAGEKLTEYGFSDEEEIKICLVDALNKAELTCLDNDLYYVSGVPYIYASDINCRQAEDLLPSRNLDSVLTLYIHYFQAADLMFINYQKLGRKWDKTGSLSRRERNNMEIYLSSWLGYLGVVCAEFNNINVRILLNDYRPKGFKELIPLSDNIGRLRKKHADSLRKFRNNVFHLRKDSGFIRDFLEDKSDRINWARELHVALSGFFSEYRIICEVHYVLNGRKGEAELARKKKSSRR